MRETAAIPRKGVRVPTGMAFAFDRIPHPLTTCVLLLFCASICDRSSATELVMIIEKNRVILAADSLVTDDPEHQSMRRCKIRQSGNNNYFYAVSGPTFDSKIHFDANMLVERRAKNLPTANGLNKLDVIFLPELQKELALIQKESPARYNEIVQEGTMTSVFVISVHGDNREGYVKDYKVSNGRVIPTPAKTCLGSDHVIEVGERCTTMSERDALAPLLMKRPTSKTDGSVTRVHQIMDVAENRRPNEVGPPVSILALEPAGPRWLEEGLCGEIRKPTPLPIKKTAPKPQP